MDYNIRKNIFFTICNKSLFLFYLIIVLCFSAAANLDENNPDPKNPKSFISSYDIAEIVCLFLILFNNGLIGYYEKKINFFIVVCFLFPSVLIVLKLIINVLSISDARNILIVNSCMRMFNLYCLLLYNIMNVTEILPLIYESKKINNPDIICPQIEKEEEIKKDKDCESNNLVKRTVPNKPSRKDSLFKDDSHNNKFPILIQGKIKLPIFISFDKTTENDKEFDNDSNEFLEEISILYNHETVNNINLQDKYSGLIEELNHIGDINFNVFNVSTNSNGLELLVLMNHLFRLYNFGNILGISKKVFKNYFFIVNTSYRKNPYHNSIHATDVVQTFYFITKTCNVETLCNLNELEIFSCLFAGAIHDLDHPGNNNNYEVAVQSNLALSYNDKAVLENYHLYKAFYLLKKPNADVFATFNRQNYSRSRAMIINSVLATDMAVHFTELANLKNRVKSQDFDPKTVDKDLLLNQLIHSCDVSNPSKPFEIYQIWVDRVFQEFFNQGDKEREKGLKISFLCDRFTTNIAGAQIGFIDGVVNPIFEALAVPFPNLKMINNIIQNNKEKYKKIKEEEMIKSSS